MLVDITTASDRQSDRHVREGRTPMNRRQSLKLIAGAAGALAVTGLVGRNAALAQTAPAQPAGPFKLPPLGYAYEALEPSIDGQTMMIHHQRHHGAYVNGLNGLVGRYPDLANAAAAPEALLSDMSKVPLDVRTGVRNNLGGHWNHTFFWELMTPGGAKEPSGELKAAIDRDFKSANEMMDKVNAAGLGRFGSGWAWLIVTKDKKLDVVNTANQDTPHMEIGGKPVLGVDVWEHAYYLKYQNRRGDYLKAWWNTVNWDKAGANYKKATA
jgi:Fe-Mn family superoxide dismutase